MDILLEENSQELVKTSDTVSSGRTNAEYNFMKTLTLYEVDLYKPC